MSNNQQKILYLKDKNVTVYSRFMISLVLPNPITLKLKADAADVAIGGLNETTVTIGTNKISTGGKSVAGVAGFIAFTANANTANAVKKEESTFVWEVTKINNKTTGTGQALETDTITFYTVLDVPKDPWDVNDSSADDKIQPWVTDLEFAIETANTKGQSTADTALGQLTTYLHSGHGMTYDTTNGESHFLSSTGSTFNLSNYITKTGGNTVNCYDQAAAVTALGRLLGIEVQFRYMEPFGYINTVNLVGVGSCNNPFYDNTAYSNDKIISGYTGSDGLPRSKFSSHSFATLNSNIYDACAGPITGDTLDQYLKNVLVGYVSGSTLPTIGTILLTNLN
jgi:hypothetical protein